MAPRPPSIEVVLEPGFSILIILVVFFLFHGNKKKHPKEYKEHHSKNDNNGFHNLIMQVFRNVSTRAR